MRTRLDTAVFLTDAISLYRRMGFVEIEPYTVLPRGAARTALFMEWRPYACGLQRAESPRKASENKYSVFYYSFPFRDEGLKRHKSQVCKSLTPNDIFGPVGADGQFGLSGLHLGRVRRSKNLARRKKSPDGVPAGAGERAFQTFAPPTRFGSSAGMQHEAKGHFAGPGATQATLPGARPTP
jgi:hypothetical protein